MRVVLDTNVIVSAFIVALGAPARIMSAWRDVRFHLIVSESLLAEYARSLAYPRVLRRTGFTLERVADEVTAIRELAILVTPETVPAVVPTDPDDDEVLAAAHAGGADYIVSGDPDLLDLRNYEGIRIVSPAAFAALLDQERPSDG